MHHCLASSTAVGCLRIGGWAMGFRDENTCRLECHCIWKTEQVVGTHGCLLYDRSERPR